MTDYLKPGTLIDALAAVGAGGGSATDAENENGAVATRTAGAVTLAGGTDLVVQWRHKRAPLPDLVVDLKGIDGMAAISADSHRVRIGPCATLGAIARDPIVAAHCAVLARAASVVACPQVRNRATIGGNLCNASPAADTAVCLIVLDAELEIASLDDSGAVKTRSVPAHAFFTGPGETVLRRGELLSAIHVPCGPNSADRAEGGGGAATDQATTGYRAFEKFGTRPSMEIAVVSVGVALDLEWGKVVRARTAFGSVAPVPHRGRKTELCLEGKSLDDAAIENACAIAMGEVSPISDVRASAGYRKELLGILLGRMLRNARHD